MNFFIPSSSVSPIIIFFIHNTIEIHKNYHPLKSFLGYTHEYSIDFRFIRNIMFALFYCRTKAIISLARVGRNGNCYKSHKVGSLLLHLGSGIKHYDTRIALIRFKRGFKHLSTSKKRRMLTHFVCAYCKT